MPIDHDDLRAKCDAATPAPWIVGHWSGRCTLDHGRGAGGHGQGDCVYTPFPYAFSGIRADAPGVNVISTSYDELEISDADAAFIAAARTAVPALLDEVAQLRGRIAAQPR